MRMEILDNFFWVPMAAVAAYLLYRFLKYGSLRGMMYGSSVVRTVGEVVVGRSMGTPVLFMAFLALASPGQAWTIQASPRTSR